MRKLLYCRFLVFAAVLLSVSTIANAQAYSNSIWSEVNESSLSARPADRLIVPSSYRVFQLDKFALRSVLNEVPNEFSGDAMLRQTIITLPMPDGTLNRFRIEQSLVVEPGLLKKYPELANTFRGQGIDDPTATVRFDMLPNGFHSMILSPKGTVMVDPYSQGDTNNYITYFKRDAPKTSQFACEFDQESAIRQMFSIGKSASESLIPDQAGENVMSGTQLRTYRLALGATGEYSTVVASPNPPTVAATLAAQVLIMNRVNGVYERDFAIHMNIIANNDQIIYLDGSTDPYTNNNGSTMLTENTTNLNNVIGTANYDIGHVFSTGGGGVAVLNGPCGSNKARGVTGLTAPFGDAFAIDYVAHEMGHQFGANHTFNGTVGSCGGGNRSAGSAYEPGSGITIMAYAGICGNQNLDPHSIDTFHVKSIEAIVAYSQTGNGNTCAVTTPTNNTPPNVAVVGGPSFNIPKQTPFTLAATGSDVNGDTITYDWQEYDLGGSTTAVPNTDSDGVARPIFKPILPGDGSRTFPSLAYILNNANVPPSTTGSLLTGELLPSITRVMNFQVIARDNRAGGGGVNTATATVNVDGTAGPFNVTSPNTGVTLNGGSVQNITWDVAGTSGGTINAANVKISLSTDGGLTFPAVLFASTPNDGSEAWTVPSINTSTARIRVEAVNNIFFDISDANFTIVAGSVSSGIVGGRIVNSGGRGVKGVRVRITGPGLDATVLTTSFGYYNFTGVNFNNTYTITPVPEKGRTFNPVNIVRSITADATDVNFTAQ